jgi:hypothetical protein
MLHALRHPVDVFGLDDNLIMVVGPGQDGMLLEVGFVSDQEETMVVIHAMTARDKFLRW